MWSARSHSDADYMIQLAGRLTRTPLAKRAGNGDDTVDTAFCYLPFFDPELAKRAGEYLSGRTMLFDCQPATAVGRVYINPVEITWGGGHEDDWSMDDVEKAWDGIETAIIPRKSPNPLRSLVNAVTLFVNLKWDAPRVKHLFVTRLKALADEHRDEWDATLERIRTIDAKRITVDALTGETHVKQVRVAANKDVIARSAKAASRAFTPDLCMAYRKARAKELRRNDTVLFDTELAVAAACEPIRDGLRAWATDLLDGMMDSRAAERAFLPEDRKAEFDAIEGGHVSWRPLERPKPLRARHASSKYPIQQCEGSLPAWPKHVYADRRGMYHCKANDLEKLVLDTELPRERTVAWYRNPSANTARSFAVPYTVNGETKGLHPDFLFFTRMPDGSVRPSAVDPHGGHLADALPKLNGWCDWIDAHPDAFAQVLSVSDTPDDGTRMLDLTDARVRAAVRAWGEPDAVGLYAGPLSHPYA